MSRGRKPLAKSLATATDDLHWRSKILLEMCDGLELPIQLHEPIRRLRMALEDFEASKHPVNGHAQLELQP